MPSMRPGRRWLLGHGGRVAGLSCLGGWGGLGSLPAWRSGDGPMPLAAAMATPAAIPVSAAACGPWPAWQAYASAFIQADGRVIDDQHETRYTTSEGQAYSLFFALVADDRARFDTLLQWTDTHLAQGRLGERLPGWRWGRRDDGSWGLADANAASDADLWLAHTLFEASRRWHRPGLRAMARALLRLVRAQEVIQLEGFGPMLLPGPQGFVLPGGVVRLNPSYLPLHQLRALAREDPQGPWAAMADRLPRFIAAVSPHGLAPDWVRHHPGKGWQADESQAWLGSHDAIRVYLWAGMAHRDDPRRLPLLKALEGMHRVATGSGAVSAGSASAPSHRAAGLPPMRVDVARGQALPQGPAAPPGFAAALLPYARALGRDAWQRQLMQRLDQARTGTTGPAGPVPAACLDAGARLLGASPAYYDQVLALFGEGALQGRFGFDAAGRLWTARRP